MMTVTVVAFVVLVSGGEIRFKDRLYFETPIQPHPPFFFSLFLLGFSSPFLRWIHLPHDALVGPVLDLR